jgi:hypothetical protein
MVLEEPEKQVNKETGKSCRICQVQGEHDEDKNYQDNQKENRIELKNNQ